MHLSPANAPAPTWLPLQPSDTAAVAAIAEQVHTSLPERPDVFAEKIRLAPDSCFKLLRDGQVAGYGLAHPWTLFSIPPLDGLLGRLPSAPDCLYIHDIALLPEGRGQNASAVLLEHLRQRALAQKLPCFACVSVYGTAVYWSRFGFKTADVPALTPKLRSYGESACYMICPLGPRPLAAA